MLSSVLIAPQALFDRWIASPVRHFIDAALTFMRVTQPHHREVAASVVEGMLVTGLLYGAVAIVTNKLRWVNVCVSGSMEPTMFRYDIFVVSRRCSYNVGDIIVYSLEPLLNKNDAQPQLSPSHLQQQRQHNNRTAPRSTTTTTTTTATVTSSVRTAERSLSGVGGGGSVDDLSEAAMPAQPRSASPPPPPPPPRPTTSSSASSSSSVTSSIVGFGANFLSSSLSASSQYQQQPNRRTPIVHRIVSIAQTADGQAFLLTKGDNNSLPDVVLYPPPLRFLPLRDDVVQGKVVFIVPFGSLLGRFAVWADEHGGAKMRWFLCAALLSGGLFFELKWGPKLRSSNS